MTSVHDRLAELEARLQRSRDPLEQEHIEIAIAELAQALDDPPLPPASDPCWAEWAMEGEQRMLEQMGWGRDDC